MKYKDKLEYHIYWILKNYFNTLHKTGYLQMDTVDDIQVLIALEEFLQRFDGKIIDCHNKIIHNVINRILGSSCIIPQMRTNPAYFESLSNNIHLTQEDCI